jgi:hypothetical protein
MKNLILSLALVAFTMPAFAGGDACKANQAKAGTCPAAAKAACADQAKATCSDAQKAACASQAKSACCDKEKNAQTRKAQSPKGASLVKR